MIPKEKVFSEIDSQIEKGNDLIEEKNNRLILNERVDKSEEKEEKTVIKGRKLMRKSDRLKGEASGEDTQISEEKKNEVLNKLANLTEKDDNSSNWNNWFSDIKSAAKTATSTTVSHVSQASNKWSFDPKSLLSSAATITSTVGEYSLSESLIDSKNSISFRSTLRFRNQFSC